MHGLDTSNMSSRVESIESSQVEFELMATRSGDSEYIETDHHYKRTINKKCGLQGQSVQVLEGPNHCSGIFRRGRLAVTHGTPEM